MFRPYIEPCQFSIANLEFRKFPLFRPVFFPKSTHTCHGSGKRSFLKAARKHPGRDPRRFIPGGVRLQDCKSIFFPGALYEKGLFSCLWNFFSITRSSKKSPALRQRTASNSSSSFRTPKKHQNEQVL